MSTNKTTIAVVVFIFIALVISLAFLFSGEALSLLNKNRPLMEKIVKIIPSPLLLLFRYDLFNKFMLIFAFLSMSLILIVIISYWLLLLVIKTKSQKPKTKIVLIAMGLVAILPGTTYCYRYVQSRVLFVRGFQKMQARQDTKAVNLYRASAKLAPLFSLPHIELMEAYTNSHQYQKAIEIGEQYLTNGFNFQIAMMLGELYSTIGDYQTAIRYYTLAVQTRESLEVNYEIANAFFMMSKYEESIQICLNYPRNNRFLYLCAKSLLELGKHNEGLKAVSDAIRLNPADPNYWYLKARLLSCINKDQNALKALEEAIWLKKEFPQAYIEMARIFFKEGDIHSCKEHLRKAVYYDNTVSDVFVWLELLNRGKFLALDEIEKDRAIRIILPTLQLEIEKDKSAEIVVKAEVPIGWNTTRIACIEPYGWGVTCQLIEEYKARHRNTISYVAKYEITGNRDCTVNVGKPWRVRFVAFDSENGKYGSEALEVIVRDKREGKILFVLTEDLECGEGPHMDDSSPHRSDLSVEEIEVDLMKKGILADKIANSNGIKWSHIVDVGSSYLMLKWLSEVSEDPRWRMTWEGIKKYLTMTVASGNDVQLHIHSYNIPGSPNFTQRYDRETNQSVSYPSTYNGPSGAWAGFYTDLGYFDNDMSRVGSLFRGVRLCERLLHVDFPSYRVLFFRAGEWEFGETEEEMQKSIIALRKNKIFAGSNAYEGNLGQKNFSFRRRIGENIYFTTFNNIRKPARSLLDVGILEMLPVTELHHYSHTRPIDDPVSIRIAYDLCLDSDRSIRTGVHVLMEMYHINRINFGDTKWNSLDSNYGDWMRIRRHLANVASYAIKAKFATVSEAIIEYLDYYTPDIVALRVNEQKEDETRYVYDIKMVGNDIPIDETYIHYVSIKPPSYFADSIKTITLLHNGRKIKKWDKIASYEDLEFEARARSGYTIRVDLQTPFPE